MSLYGPTFHVTPVNLCIIFQSNIYIYPVSCLVEIKLFQNCFKLFQIVSQLFQIVSDIRIRIILKLQHIDINIKLLRCKWDKEIQRWLHPDFCSVKY